MPFSDNPPAYVIPDDNEWRYYATREVLPDLGRHAKYCPDFSPTPDIDDTSARVMDVRYKTRACRNRNALGDRFHNWCYRCPAGLLHVRLHIYDADRDRDRAVRL